MAKPDWEAFGKAIWAMTGWPDQGLHDIDAGDAFDAAKEAGIIREIPGGFDPDQHFDNGWGAEKGDPWYEINHE